MQELSILFFSGIIVGLMGAFFGVGGGIIIIPLLTMLFDFTIHEAVAASLVIVVANSIATSSKYMKKGIANLNVGLFIALFSICGSIFGSVVSVTLSQKILYITLGLFQISIASFMLYKEKWNFSKKNNPIIVKGSIFTSSYYDENEKKTVEYTFINPIRTSLFSLFSGILSGLVGVGGGVLIVPAMNILSKMPIKAATATSTVTMGFTAAAAGVVFYLSGYLRPDAVAVIILGVLVSTTFAVRIFNKVNSKKIYRYFIYLLFIIAVQMVYKGIKSQ